MESGYVRLAATRLATLTAHAALSISYKQGNKVDHRLFRFEVNIRDQENTGYIGMRVGVKTYPALFYGIIVKESSPEVQVVSLLVSCVLLSAWFAWCLVFISGMGCWHTG